MEKLESKRRERFVLYIVLICILIGLLSSHIIDEQKHYKDELIQDIDAATIRANQVLQVERVVMEATSLSLSSNSGKALTTTEILDRLRPLIDRKVYDYSLFIEPSTVINGNNNINPSDLIKQHKKKYGEKIYLGSPYYDSERKAINLPIAMYVNAGDADKRTMLFTEVDFSSLIRDFTRLNSKRGGQGFLIDSEGNLFNLSINVGISNASTRIAHLVVEQGVIDQPQKRIIEDHQVLVRSIAGTELKLLYIEKVPDLIEFDNLQVILAGLVLLMMLMLIGNEWIRANLKIKSNGDRTETPIRLEHDPFFKNAEWLKAEVEQFKFLYGKPHAKDLIHYKMSYCLNKLSGTSFDDEHFSSAEFSRWVMAEIENSSNAVQFEYVEDPTPFTMTPGMIYSGIALIAYFESTQFEGKVHLITDAENQLLMMNCFVKDAQSHTDSILPQSFISHLNLYNEDAHLMVIGTKIIISHHHKVDRVSEVSLAIPEKSVYPESVIVYEHTLEQNAILKFYLEHLKIAYKSVMTLKDIPTGSVVLITETTYLNLMDANQMGFSLPYHFVICGDVAQISNLELVTISRPYALDKVAYALSRVAAKQAKMDRL